MSGDSFLASTEEVHCIWKTIEILYCSMNGLVAMRLIYQLHAC